MATVTDAVARAQDAAGDIQNLLDALASKLQQGGDTVIRTSNAATGAVYGAGAGAKAGAAAPLDIPPVVKYGGIVLLAYLLMKR